MAQLKVMAHLDHSIRTMFAHILSVVPVSRVCTLNLVISSLCVHSDQIFNSPRMAVDFPDFKLHLMLKNVVVIKRLIVKTKLEIVMDKKMDKSIDT